MLVLPSRHFKSILHSQMFDNCYLSPCQRQRPGSLALQGLCSQPQWRCRCSEWRRATGRSRPPPPLWECGWRRATAGRGPLHGWWDGGNAGSHSPEGLRETGDLPGKKVTQSFKCYHINTVYKDLMRDNHVFYCYGAVLGIKFRCSAFNYSWWYFLLLESVESSKIILLRWHKVLIISSLASPYITYVTGRLKVKTLGCSSPYWQDAELGS